MWLVSEREGGRRRSCVLDRLITRPAAGKITISILKQHLLTPPPLEPLRVCTQNCKQLQAQIAILRTFKYFLHLFFRWETWQQIDSWNYSERCLYFQKTNWPTNWSQVGGNERRGIPTTWSPACLPNTRTSQWNAEPSKTKHKKKPSVSVSAVCFQYTHTHKMWEAGLFPSRKKVEMA